MKKLNLIGLLLLLVIFVGCKSIEISGSGHEEYPEFKDGYRDGDPDEIKYTTVEEWKKMQEEKKAAEAEEAEKKKKKK